MGRKKGIHKKRTATKRWIENKEEILEPENTIINWELRTIHEKSYILMVSFQAFIIHVQVWRNLNGLPSSYESPLDWEWTPLQPLKSHLWYLSLISFHYIFYSQETRLSLKIKEIIKRKDPRRWEINYNTNIGLWK